MISLPKTPLSFGHIHWQNDVAECAALWKRGVMKYFLFDIGHVLVDFDFQDFLDEIAKQTGRSVEPLCEHDYIMHDAVETGQISDEEWVEYLNEAKGLSWSRDDLIALWSRMFTVNEVGRTLFSDALKAGLPVYALSNIAKLHMDAIENNWSGFFEGADGLFLSYQIGVRKPDAAIYKRALQELGVDGEQCFFIDDRAENIEAARTQGIEALQFIPENHAVIREAVVNFFDLA
jgi:putative hydrolase of the HAD superfamily